MGRAGWVGGVSGNEDQVENPERWSRRVSQRLQAQRHRRVVQALPPECSRAELRKLRNLTQERVGRALGVNQARISRMERCGNPELRLLRSYVEALGGRLHLLARFAQGDFRITLDGAAENC